MKTYTNPEHPEQGSDPSKKHQLQADRESERGLEREEDNESDLESDDDNLDDGSGTTENPAVQESMN